MADVDEIVAVVVAEEHGTEVLARVARLGVASHHELLTKFDLELEPVVRSCARLIACIDAFRDDAFPVVAAGAREQLLAVARSRVAEPNADRRLRSDDLFEPLPTDGPRL